MSSSEVSVWDYFCSCGFTSPEGQAAVDHVKQCHDGKRSYGQLTLASRIRIWIYSIGHSVDELAMHHDQPSSVATTQRQMVAEEAKLTL